MTDNVEEVVDKMTTLKTTWSDGIQHDWFFFSCPSLDVCFQEGGGFWNVVNKMIYMFMCPETGREIMIIKGASHLFRAVQGVQYGCEGIVQLFLEFNHVATRSMTKIARIQATPYLRKIVLAKDMQETMLRASDGENGSGDNQSFLCENCATPSRYRTHLRMRCRQCEALVQPYGYLITYDPEFMQVFRNLFEDNTRQWMMSEEFVQLSKRLLQSIADH